jgi:DNA-binding MarR family transcriptional regulator
MKIKPRKSNDPYEVILEKMREYPNDIPTIEGKISEAFKEYIQLLFTPEEAEIAQYLDVKPLRLREIANLIGKEKNETKKILDEMVNNGIIGSSL